MKLLAKILAALLVISIALVVALPFFVDANTFRPMLETRLSAGLGRTVKLGNLRLAVLSGDLVANNISIAGDPAFSPMPFLVARELRIGVDMKPLLLHHQLHIRSFEIEAPQIHLVQGANGQWNFSSLSRHAASLTSDSPSAGALFRSVVDAVAIQDGRALVETLPASGPPLVYDHVKLKLRNFALAQRFPFEAAATLPGNGIISAKGNIGPINAENAAKTPAVVDLAMQHLDPVAVGFLDPNAEISMVAGVTAHATSDGNTVHSSGTLHMQALQLRKSGAPSPQPIDLVYDITHQMDEKTGQVQQASIGLGKGTIHISGTYRLAGADPSIDVILTAAAVPIDELQSLMTSAGVTLPDKSHLLGGTLTLNLKVDGAVNDLRITGPVQLENTSLVGYDLGSKISGIASLGGVKTGTTTTIQSMKLDFSATNSGIQVNHIDGTIVGMGRSTGRGTISPAGALSFRLVAHVTNARGAGKVGVGLMTKMNQFGRPAAEKEAAQGVPMRVTGTANDPVITADVSGLVHRNASTLATKVKHWFGRKPGHPSSSSYSPQ